MTSTASASVRRKPASRRRWRQRQLTSVDPTLSSSEESFCVPHHRLSLSPRLTVTHSPSLSDCLRRPARRNWILLPPLEDLTRSLLRSTRAAPSYARQQRITDLPGV